MEERSKLTAIKAMVAQKLSEAGFNLDNFAIHVSEDDNHVAHIQVTSYPWVLMTDEEKETLEKFKDIVGEI